MQIKSTFHFVHKSIGKATHAKQAASSNVFYITRDGELGAARSSSGTEMSPASRSDLAQDREQGRDVSAAEAAVGYNARESAASVVLAARMPSNRTDAARWLDQHSAADRANARVADTFIMSLPIELSREQNAALLKDWCESVTKGQAAYFAVIHDKGKDAQNPHAHVITRDRDYSKDYPREKDRPRVIGTSTGRKELADAQRRGVPPPPMASSKDLRSTWADATNRHLERAGLDVRVDPRSYKERGIERKAGIHVGRAGPRMEARGIVLTSRDVERGDQLLAYSVTDAGSRAQYNASIKAENQRHELLKSEAGARDIAASDQGAPPRRTREERQRDELLEQQRRGRTSMYGAQKLAIGQLRSGHAAETAQYKIWAKGLSREMQDQAFAAVGAEFKARWAGIDAMPEGPERRAAAVALKQDQSATAKAAMAAAKAEARMIKAARQAEIAARQKQERDAMAASHKQEQKRTYQQHRSARDVLQGKWDAVAAQRLTGILEKRLSGSQSMAQVQRAALQLAALQQKRDGQQKNGQQRADEDPSRDAPALSGEMTDRRQRSQGQRKTDARRLPGMERHDDSDQ